MNHKLILKLAFNLTLYLTCVPSVKAQIVIDKAKIKAPTIIKSRKPNFIEFSGGTRRGENLFHSFKEFNLTSNDSVKFSNPKVNNLLIRVAGKKPSILNGLIESPNSKNLIFFNPNGFFIESQFVPIGFKSLTFTTSQSIEFSDKFRLTKNSFIGETPSNSFVNNYRFNNSSGNISVDNLGTIISRLPNQILISNNAESSKIEALAGGEINLFAGNINLSGGLLVAPSGSIQLAAIKNGTISESDLFRSETKNLGEIKISDHSLLDASGFGFGKINTIAKSINIHSGSTLLISNFINSNSSINIESQKLELKGLTSSSKIFTDSLSDPLKVNRNISSILILNQTGGVSTNVNIDSNQIDISDGTIIGNSGGNININATNIDLEQGTNILPFFNNDILAGSFSNSAGGNINITSDQIRIKNGSRILTTAFSSGDAGNLNIFASDIFASGFSNFSTNTTIGSATVGSGSSGNIRLETDRLSLTNRATVTSLSSGLGDTGNLDISAKSILIQGIQNPLSEQGRLNPNSNTGISSIVFPNAPSLDEAELLNIAKSQGLNGKTGNIRIKANNILIDNGVVTSGNAGLGDGGEFEINSNRLVIRESAVSTNTVNGDGGRFRLNTKLLQVEDSTITSRARNFGTGGGIEIESDLFAAKGLNAIEANADNNFGGDILISANTAILSRGTSITATSNRGPTFDGSIRTDIQNTQLIKTIKLSPIREPNVEVSQICGFDGNRLSATSKADFEVIASNSDLITAWSIQQRYLTHEGKYFRDIKTGEVKPIRPVLALEYMDNGEIRSIFEPEDSEYVLNLISSLEIKCSELHST